MTQIIDERAVARQLDESAKAEVEPEPYQGGSDFPLIPVQSSASDRGVRFSSGASLFQDLGTEDFYFESDDPVNMANDIEIARQTKMKPIAEKGAV